MKRFVRGIRALALAGAIAVCGGSASATTIPVTKEFSSIWGPNGHGSVKITTTGSFSNSTTVQAGGFSVKGDLNGDSVLDSFVAWCLDITTTLALPANYTITSAPFTSLPLSAAQKANIAKLYSAVWPTLNLTDNAQSAGFQLALWEIGYETGSTLGLGSGNFRSSSTYNAAAVTAGNSFLTNLLSYSGPAKYKVTYLEATPHRSQNLVTASPVPLPGALLLLLSGLGGLGAARFARRRKAA